MMHFLNTHPDDFSNSFYPFAISLMQAFGGLFAEALNLFMVATRSDVKDCITFFIAFRVLSNIDDIYFESLTDFILRDAVEEPLRWKRSQKQIKFQERSCGHKIIRITCCGLSFFYNSVYYYYMPFVVNFIPYLFS
jgi:hypothetical protein